ncbi:MAG: nickel-dependent hydrogenase large subunit [Candidatus Hydrothermae bacterium]|nr:nickel-dependent hydrogenase large subunit [Candidatus Hydrothermae bacterium]
MTEEIRVESLARVEGHGGITVTLKDNKVEDVRVEIFEGPRLIEALVVGKTPEEDLNITPRICAICTVSHKYAALRGLEKALGVKVPKKTHLTRELMHMGEIIESNALHVFLLALPDFLGYPSAVHMANDHLEAVKAGLALKKFGNRIMEITTARATHGENPVLGGFGRFPSSEELKELKKTA